MGTANRDASLTTARRKQIALYGFRKSVNYPVGTNGFVPAEQSTSAGFQQAGPSSTVSVDAFIGAQVLGASGAVGACACTASTGTVAFDKRSPGC